MKYVKKPIEIQAFRLGFDQYPQWFVDAFEKNQIAVSPSIDGLRVRIPTREGYTIADRGDYIVQGVKGEIYPCKSDIFEETYESVKE